jgi:uncharacterized membrane protein YhhN
VARLIPVPRGVITAVLLVRAAAPEQRQVYVLKPLTTLLVILVAALSFLSPTADPGFTVWMLVALVFSLNGDVAPMFKDNRAFMGGQLLIAPSPSCFS